MKILELTKKNEVKMLEQTKKEVSYIIDKPKQNDILKDLETEESVTENEGKIFRLIKMEVIERSPYYGGYDDNRGSISMEETERIYSRDCFYLAIPPEWLENTPAQIQSNHHRFIAPAKGKIYSLLLERTWTSQVNDMNGSFYTQNNKDERFIDVRINRVEPEIISNMDRCPSLYIFQKDYSFKILTSAKSREFLLKGKFISPKSRFRAVIISINDPSIEKETASLLAELLEKERIKVVETIETFNNLDNLVEKLNKYINLPEINLIFTVGGTGIRGDDLAQKAAKQVIEKEIPKIAERIRSLLFKDKSFDGQFRGTAGMSGKALVINCPESRKQILKCFPALESIFYKFKGSITNTEIQAYDDRSEAIK